MRVRQYDACRVDGVATGGPGRNRRGGRIQSRAGTHRRGGRDRGGRRRCARRSRADGCCPANRLVVGARARRDTDHYKEAQPPDGPVGRRPLRRVHVQEMHDPVRPGRAPRTSRSTARTCHAAAPSVLPSTALAPTVVAVNPVRVDGTRCRAGSQGVRESQNQRSSSDSTSTPAFRNASAVTPSPATSTPLCVPS